MMTYGWAILIIVIVAGVLYSFGIFNPSSSASVTITGFSGLGSVTAECYSNLTGQGYSQNIGLVLTFGNNLGSAINITSINVTDSAISRSFSIQSNDVIVSGGSAGIFEVPNVCPSAPGSRYSATVTITYTEPGQVFPGPYYSSGTSSGTTLSGSSFPNTVGLIGFWPLSEGSGSVAHDLSGNGYNGVITNGVWVSSPKFGYYLNFSGTGYVNTTYTQTSVALYTVFAWVKLSGNFGGIVTNDRGDGAGHSLTLFTNSAGCSNSNGEVAFLDDSNGLCNGLFNGGSLSSGQWYSLAGVFDSVPGSAITSQQFSIFVNGTKVAASPVGSGDTSPLTGLGGMLIGHSLAWNAYFTGGIARVGVYNHALTANEINEMTVYNTLI